MAALTRQTAFSGIDRGREGCCGPPRNGGSEPRIRLHVSQMHMTRGSVYTACTLPGLFRGFSPAPSVSSQALWIYRFRHIFSSLVFAKDPFGRALQQPQLRSLVVGFSPESAGNVSQMHMTRGSVYTACTLKPGSARRTTGDWVGLTLV